MAPVTIENIQYIPGTDAVAFFVKYGPMPFFLHSTQPALTARTAGGDGVWSDDEALAEVQAILDGTADPAVQAQVPAELAAILVGQGLVAVFPGAGA